MADEIEAIVGEIDETGDSTADTAAMVAEIRSAMDAEGTGAREGTAGRARGSPGR